MWRKENPHALLVGMQIGAPLWKALWSYLKKLKMELPYDPVIPLLGIYLKKTDTLIGKNIKIPLFIAALFTIAKIWKQLVSITELVDKKAVVDLHSGILLSNNKKFYPLQQCGQTWRTLC